MNLGIGFQAAEADGSAYTSAAGGVPTVLDNVLSTGVVTEEWDSVFVSGSYGLFVSDSIELGTRISLGTASADLFTETTTDFDGDGFSDRSLAAAKGTDDLGFFTIGGYTRFYPWVWNAFAPWVQVDFGFYTGDLSGSYLGGSVGGSFFIGDNSAIEARLFSEALSEDDDTTGVGFEVGYSLFR